MQLWNDYEGRTIAEAYPLKKLIRPEGRSAFFLTTNGTGTPSMVRLIEAHFDESEILTRWKTISEIHQENLVEMRKFGETSLDGTPLVYAVMEPTEMSLADLLQNRTLTVEETKQLAASLIAALTALHQRGLVHEHLDPTNVLAAGETVKLRSDCVREAASPDGDEAEANRRKAADVQELAALLLQAMTGRRSLQGSATMLTPPFDGIIRNGLSGKWGLSEMATALGPVAKPQEPATPASAPAVPKVEARPQPAVAIAQKTEAPKASSAGPLFEKPETSKAAATPEPAASRTAAVSETAAARPLTQTHAPDVRHRIVRPVEQEPKRLKMIAAIAIAALVLLAVGWYFLRSGRSPAPKAATTATARTPVRSAAAPAPVAAAAPAPAPTAADTAAPVRTGRTEWRVVAYTYNHQDQAQKKADELRAKHPALNPEVFSPHGRAPYLVTVGGAMTRDQAIAFRAKARGAGLPRDTYARNYSR
jgi:hypothetical protein